MKLKHFLLSSLAAITLFSACSSDNDAINDNTLRVSTDNVKYTINLSDFDLKGDVKSVEKTYYPQADYSWTNNDSIAKSWTTAKEIRFFDNNGALTKSQDRFINENWNGVLFYNQLEKNWAYDEYYRITEYTEQNSTHNLQETTTLNVSSNKLEYIFDDNAKQATANYYLGDTKGTFSLLKTAQYVLGDDKRIVYPEDVTKTNTEKSISTRNTIDQNIYGSFLDEMDFEKSKKQLYQYTDSKGNVVLSYLRYDIRDADNNTLLYNYNGSYIIKNYYEQTISYIDGTSSANSTLTEKITDEEFEILICSTQPDNKYSNND